MTKSLTGAERTLLDALDTLGVPVGNGPSPEALARARETVERLKADAKRNGRTAQRNREIDEERRGAGRADYALQRKVEYHAHIQQNEGREVRSYGVPDSEDKRVRRRNQNNAAKLKHRATRTPEQIEADRQKDRERKRAKRLAAKS
jgi:hypothetical protein